MTSRNADDTIVYRAEVLDNTKTFFDTFDRNVSKSAANGASSFESFSRSILPAGNATNVLAGAIGGLSVEIVRFAGEALANFRDFIVEATNAATSANLLGDTIAFLGERTGRTKTEVQELEESIKSQGVSIRAAREFMIAMVRAQLDFSQASELVRVAQDAAVISQRSVSESLTRLISAIQKSEPRLLDELGLQVRREEAYKRVAVQLNKSVSNLSEYERRQGFVNEILRKATVFSGAYEATLGNVGRQSVEVSRFTDDLKVQLGQLFQPSRAALVQEYTRQLQSALKWFEENTEAVDLLGKSIGDATTLVLRLVSALLQTAVNVPSTIKNAGVEVAQYFAAIFDIASPEEIAKRTESLSTYFFQALSIVGGFINASVTAIINSLKLVDYVVDATIAKIRGNNDEVRKNLEGFQNLYDNFTGELKSSFESGVVNVATYTGLMGEAKDATEDFGDASIDVLGSLDEGLEQTNEEVEKMISKFKDLRKSLQNLLDKREVDAIEREFDELERIAIEAIRNAQQREDIERKYQERIAKIRESAAEASTDYEAEATEERVKLAEDAAKRRADIERDYVRTVEDIMNQFAFDVTELARSRDAVGILRLIRQRKKDLSDAATDRSRDLEDEAREQEERQADLESRLKKRRKTIEDSLQKELEAAEEARIRDLEDLERNQQRELLIREIQERFKEQARQREFARELQQFEEQYRELLDTLDVNLDTQTLQWVLYFNNLFDLVDTNLSDIEALYNAFSPKIGLPTAPQPGTNVPPPLPGRSPTGGRGTPTIGQGGIVSQLLGNNIPSLAQFRAPIVNIGSTGGVNTNKRIEVVVDAPTLEPYIQRVLVTTIAEIERNSNA